MYILLGYNPVEENGTFRQLKRNPGDSTYGFIFLSWLGSVENLSKREIKEIRCSDWPGRSHVSLSELVARHLYQKHGLSMEEEVVYWKKIGIPEVEGMDLGCQHGRPIVGISAFHGVSSALALHADYELVPRVSLDSLCHHLRCTPSPQVLSVRDAHQLPIR